MHGLDKPDSALPRGIVDPRGSASRIRVTRYPPSPRFAPFVDHHWIVEWNLSERAPEPQRVLPSPHAHLVIGSGHTALFGVVRGIYSRYLRDTGRVLGTRFRCGGLRPFLNGPMAALTDRTVAARMLTGVEDHVAEARILGAADHQSMVRATERGIESRLPAADSTVEQIGAIAALARRNDGPRQVETLADQAGVTPRTLQRLFHEYVGISPKWLIRCYRLQEAAQRLGRGEQLRIVQLAAELGYFDQAHLARDFRCLFGCSPEDYRRSQIGP